MKLEDFIKLGLDEETAKKCETALLEELKGYIPKSRFDEINNEKKKLEADVKDRNKQLEDLKKSSGDNEELKKQIEQLQKDNKLKEENYALEMKKFKVDAAIDRALSGAGAKNIKSVKALLEGIEKYELKDDGTIDGLDYQITKIRESDPYLFSSSETTIKGIKPSESLADGKNVDPKNMTYSQLVEHMANNPDFVLD